MKRKILCSMLAVMTSICMLTACGNSSNPVQDTKSTDATKNDSMVQEEENAQIVAAVRSYSLTPEELEAFLKERRMIGASAFENQEEKNDET